MTDPRIILILFFLAILNGSLAADSKDSVQFSGQLSGWSNFNRNNSLPVNTGLRYIPTLDLGIQEKKGRLFDFEGSVNITGTLAFHPFDSLAHNGSIKPYRFWIRYSSEQFELRAGLQKINFGSASMLRPLMWFDQLDPRDPLQLTDGVWGLLFRYYFLNNANLWLWSLYGNEKNRAWEIVNTVKKYPEIGGRIQLPVPRGELAISTHYRTSSTERLSPFIPALSEVPESRIGLDGKWDLGVGLWTESTWIHKYQPLSQYTNQEMVNLGMDNTFGIGNGLNLTLEHLVVAFDSNAFAFNQPVHFTGLSMNYPVSMSDMISGITYFDWKNKQAYNFLNWKHDFGSLIVYLMAWMNPKKYNLPQVNNQSGLFAGNGFQLMLVYYH